MEHLTSNIVCKRVMRNGEKYEEHSVLLKEHAMDIYVDGECYTSVRCTKEWLEELVIGRLAADGMLSSMEEMKELKSSEDQSVVDVELVSENDMALNLYDFVKEEKIYYPDEWVFAMIDTMAADTPIHEKTRSAHSCFLFKEGELVFSCEDIGRHNAVDKVIGYAIKNQVNLTKCAVYTSGRVPFDMADKIAVAGIPVLVSKGMPSMQAVQLAEETGITLICGTKADQIKIYVDHRKK